MRRRCPLLLAAKVGVYCDKQCGFWVPRLHGCLFVSMAEALESIAAAVEEKRKGERER